MLSDRDHAARARWRSLDPRARARPARRLGAAAPAGLRGRVAQPRDAARARDRRAGRACRWCSAPPAGVLVAAGAIALVARDERIGADVGVAVVVSGAVRARRACSRSSPEAPPRLEELLFGDLLGISGADLVAAGGARASASLAALAVAHRPLALDRLRPRGGALARRRPRALGDRAARRCSASARSPPRRASAACCSSRSSSRRRPPRCSLARRLPRALALAAGARRRSPASAGSRSPTTPSSPRARASLCVPWLRRVSACLKLKS